MIPKEIGAKASEWAEARRQEMMARLPKFTPQEMAEYAAELAKRDAQRRFVPTKTAREPSIRVSANNRREIRAGDKRDPEYDAEPIIPRRLTASLSED